MLPDRTFGNFGASKSVNLRFLEAQKRQPLDFEALKLGNVRSGYQAKLGFYMQG